MSGRFVVGRSQSSDVSVDCDVCIVGSGAGGAVAAAILAQAGLSVVVLEAGGWNRRDRFTMQEQDTYPLLYQESMRRATADQAISILQGRTVGGGTVVNWTTTFRTPSHVLEHWRKRFGLTEYTDAELKPHFDAIEGRLASATCPRTRSTPTTGASGRAPGPWVGSGRSCGATCAAVDSPATAGWVAPSTPNSLRS